MMLEHGVVRDQFKSRDLSTPGVQASPPVHSASPPEIEAQSLEVFNDVVHCTGQSQCCAVHWCTCTCFVCETRCAHPFSQSF